MRDSLVYLDHAATTPMLPEAIEAMTAQMETVGNASSLHTSGRAGRRVVEESRETIAQAIGARPSEVLFTSGGTESDNLAIKGLFWARRDADPRRVRLLVSTTPVVDGRSFGTNMLEGVFVTLLGRTPEKISTEEYLELAQRIGWAPIIRDLSVGGIPENG